jgi:ATP-dependent helicase/DNAse subunit B
MDPDELQSLLTASPVADMPFERKRRQLQKLIERLSELEPSFRELANDRARALQESHERVRAIARASKRKVQVEPQLPPDIIGVYILQPCSQ